MLRTEVSNGSTDNAYCSEVPEHRYLAAWDRLQRFITGRRRSPISGAGSMMVERSIPDVVRSARNRQHP
ncbi:hypothetical protein DLM46_07420 [Paraburkholderia lacunae]|uniref:Uncharacterized protein n=1 Tax=Paraburkholderia lacunae TaxID=2211104 RepID=A0A370NCQ1_9BURK|nr:hypothetical protein DLM46_07420 [Paraburkholderia lacunae]